MARAGTFDEWLARVEDQAAERMEQKQEAEQAAEDERERKRQANSGMFDVWVQGKEHRAKSVDVSAPVCLFGPSGSPTAPGSLARLQAETAGPLRCPALAALTAPFLCLRA